MKRSLLLSLVLLLFLAACSGAAPSGSADSVSVGSAASSESAGSTPAASGEAALIEGAQRWEETEVLCPICGTFIPPHSTRRPDTSR